MTTQELGGERPARPTSQWGDTARAADHDQVVGTRGSSAQAEDLR